MMIKELIEKMRNDRWFFYIQNSDVARKEIRYILSRFELAVFEI